MSPVRFAILDEPPFCFRDPSGAACGCDVDVFRAALEGTSLSIEPIDAQFAQLLDGLADGRWQATTGLFRTPERRKRAAFSISIWRLADGLLIASSSPHAERGDVDAYRALALSGDRLAVVKGQVQIDHALANGVRPEQLAVFDDYAAAAGSVAAGRCAAFASVALAHRQMVAQSGGRLRVIRAPDAEAPPAPGGFAFHPSAGALVAQIDRALSALLGTPKHEAILRAYGLSLGDISMGDPAPGDFGPN